MSLYASIDLHANNKYLAVIDETEKLVASRRCPNDLASIRRALEPHREELVGIAVESTFNRYWLVDGLQESDYAVHLVNTLAAQQYGGLKYTDDKTDARWLAQMLRLGLRNVLERTTARRLSTNALKTLTRDDLAGWIEDEAERNSNQRLKGQGLRKNGNPYLSWACHEAAHFAVRLQPQARRWYEKKRAKTSALVAIRGLAHKLARAAYFMMRDQTPCTPARLFGGDPDSRSPTS